MDGITERLLKLVSMLEKGNSSKFAAAIGLHRQTFHYYKKGRVPDTETIARICEHYNVNPKWLLTGTGEMFEDDNNKQRAGVVNHAGNGHVVIGIGKGTVVASGSVRMVGMPTKQEPESIDGLMIEGIMLLGDILKRGGRKMIKAALEQLRTLLKVCDPEKPEQAEQAEKDGDAK